MRVAFVGKGGSGKTTLSSLFIRQLSARRLPVVAIDADINQHLGVALGLSESESAAIPSMGAHLREIKDYLRGDNPRIPSADAMVKSTPPGHGSRLLRLGGDDPVHALSRDVSGVPLMVTGQFTDDDLGVACYHSKTGAVELYLNHLVDAPGEYVVVDMTAGADTFASGLFTRFDVMFLVAEPTTKGVGVYRQYTDYASRYDVEVLVVGNKVHDEHDVDFLRTHAGDDLLTWFGHSPAIRAMEQGRPFTLDALGREERAKLALLRDAVDARPKDWDKFARQGAEFHIKNARSWANRAVGEDLTRQIDPTFAMGVDAPVSA